MNNSHGQRTRKIGEMLEPKIEKIKEEYPGLLMFYDHGSPKSESVHRANAYMGRRYGRDATLSEVDLVFVYRGKAFLLVEVEESKVSPKTILGDTFGVILASRIHISGESYPIHNATLVTAITVGNRGKRKAKYVRLDRLLQKFLYALRQTKKGTSVAKIRIVTSNKDDLVRRCERLIRLVVGKGIAAESV